MQITEIEAAWLQDNIEKIDFLNRLFPQQVLSLAQNMTPRLVMGNQTVMKEGEVGHPFFFIYNGRLSVWIERNKKRTKLATLTRGDYFGEISLLTGKPATADVIATTPSKVFFLDNQKFIDLVRTNKKLANHIAQVMKKRLTERKQAIEALRYGNMEEVNKAIRDFLQVSAASPAEETKEPPPPKDTPAKE